MLFLTKDDLNGSEIRFDSLKIHFPSSLSIRRARGSSRLVYEHSHDRFSFFDYAKSLVMAPCLPRRWQENCRKMRLRKDVGMRSISPRAHSGIVKMLQFHLHFAFYSSRPRKQLSSFEERGQNRPQSGSTTGQWKMISHGDLTAARSIGIDFDRFDNSAAIPPTVSTELRAAGVRPLSYRLLIIGENNLTKNRERFLCRGENNQREERADDSWRLLDDYTRSSSTKEGNDRRRSDRVFPIDRHRLRSRFCHHRFRISCGKSGFGNVHEISHLPTEAKRRRTFGLMVTSRELHLVLFSPNALDAARRSCPLVRQILPGSLRE